MQKTQKIVINTCFGGFGLSFVAVRKYCKLKKWKFRHYFDCITAKHYLPSPNRFEDSTYEQQSMDEAKLTKKEFDYLTKQISNKGAKRHISFVQYEVNGEYFSVHNIPRTDPDLIKVVEELGKFADGDCAELKVVEIPADVKYSIEEYDGKEHIAEKHKVWL